VTEEMKLGVLTEFLALFEDISEDKLLSELGKSFSSEKY
jgi:hypothetical protein